MRSVRHRAAWFAALFLAVAFGGTNESADARTDLGCGAVVGERVMLASGETDPDVFIWDTKQRLGDFSSDRWGSFALIMAHTVLVRPGTHGIVTHCVSGAAHDRRTGAVRDAVRVYVASGKYRGRYGWVIASDIHGVGRAALGNAQPIQAHR